MLPVATNYTYLFDSEELLQGIIDTLREDYGPSSHSVKKPTTKTKERDSQNRYLSVDNSQLYHQLRTRYASQGFETRDGEQWPVTNLSTRHDKAMAQLNPMKGQESFPNYEEMCRMENQMASFVREMNDVTADVMDMICSIWLTKAKYPDESVFVTADDFLRLRGIAAQKSGNGRRGGYKAQLRQEIAKHIQILANTWVTVFEMTVVQIDENGRRKQSKWRGDGPAVVVSGHFGTVHSNDDIDIFSWRVRPGDMFAPYLMIAGRKTALLSQRALEYHPIREKWEKRLTRYFAHIWRNRQSNGAYSDGISVSTLINAIGEQVDGRNPSRTKERFDKALDKLEGDGIIVGWQYDATVDEDIAGERGWVEKWMAWKVIVEPPMEVMDHYAQIQKHSGERTIRSKTDLATLLKADRIKKGLSQLQAAEEIGIDQGTYSRIESGASTQPNRKTMSKIKKWLQT